MYQIIIEHGLIPVPFEFDLESMNPVGAEKFASLITEKV